MSQDNTYFTWTLGFLAGVAATAATAFLLASQPGQVARHRIGRKLRYSAGALEALRARAARAAREIQDEAAAVLTGDHRRQPAAEGPAVTHP
jgi:gas vesicle protein